MARRSTSQRPTPPRELPRALADLLPLFRAEHGASKRAIDALPAGVSAAFRLDLERHADAVGAALERYRRGEVPLADAVGTIAAARARFAVIVGGAT